MKKDVLLLSSAQEPRLDAALSGMGFDIVRRHALQPALRELAKKAFAAVVALADKTDVDFVELVLNVRDFDSAVPIILISKVLGIPEAQYVRVFGRTYILKEGGDKRQLATALHELVLGKATRLKPHSAWSRTVAIEKGKR